MCQRCGYKWSAQQDDLFYYKKTGSAPNYINEMGKSSPEKNNLAFRSFSD